MFIEISTVDVYGSIYFIKQFYFQSFNYFISQIMSKVVLKNVINWEVPEVPTLNILMEKSTHWKRLKKFWYKVLFKVYPQVQNAEKIIYSRSMDLWILLDPDSLQRYIFKTLLMRRREGLVKDKIMIRLVDVYIG